MAATRSQGRPIASCDMTTQLYSAFNCPTMTAGPFTIHMWLYIFHYLAMHAVEDYAAC